MLQGWEDQDGKEQAGGWHACRVQLGRCGQTRQGMGMDRMEATLKAFATQAFGRRLGPGWAVPERGRLKWWRSRPQARSGPRIGSTEIAGLQPRRPCVSDPGDAHVWGL